MLNGVERVMQLNLTLYTMVDKISIAELGGFTADSGVNITDVVSIAAGNFAALLMHAQTTAFYWSTKMRVGTQRWCRLRC